MNSDWFWKYWHGQNVEVGLASSSHIHIHVLTCVDPTKCWQWIVGPNNELVIVTVSWRRRTKSEVNEVKPELTHWFFAVMTHSQVTLWRCVWQSGRISRWSEFKLDISSLGSTGDCLGDNSVVKRKASTRITLIGVKLNLKDVSNWLNFSWWCPPTISTRCSS